jgi:hypothetical protein
MAGIRQSEILVQTHYVVGGSDVRIFPRGTRSHSKDEHAPPSRSVAALADGGHAKGATLEAVHARAAVAVEAGRGPRSGELMTLSEKRRRVGPRSLALRALLRHHTNNKEPRSSDEPCGRPERRPRSSLRCQRDCTCSIGTRSGARVQKGRVNWEAQMATAGRVGVPAKRSVDR